MKKDKDERSKITLKLPTPLVRASKIAAIERGQSLRTLVAEALQQHVGKAR